VGYHASVRMRIDWREAFSYVMREPGWLRRVGVGGLLILVVPPIGWLLALGYRSCVGQRLVDGQVPVLPPWRGLWTVALRRGVSSSAVILTYLAPFVVTYWGVGISSLDSLATHWRELLVMLAAVVTFPPLGLPGMPPLYAAQYDWLHFSRSEAAVLAVLFLAPILLLPGAFLQVAHHRRFTAAFNVVRVVRFIAASPGVYAQAWTVALAVSAGAIIVLPLAPWLLFWSYLVITHLFLQVDRRPVRAWNQDGVATAL
jgi:hypothetical protein